MFTVYTVPDNFSQNYSTKLIQLLYNCTVLGKYQLYLVGFVKILVAASTVPSYYTNTLGIPIRTLTSYRHLQGIDKGVRRKPVRVHHSALWEPLIRCVTNVCRISTGNRIRKRERHRGGRHERCCASVDPSFPVVARDVVVADDVGGAGSTAADGAVHRRLERQRQARTEKKEANVRRRVTHRERERSIDLVGIPSEERNIK